LEGNVVATRSSTNGRFYGNSSITAIDILMGEVPPPRAATPLYNALGQLFAN
jgi:lipid-binding SYLF domain-containing protein